ncbi:flavodoxin domain-containing protein [Robertkochia sediminum]|uniref:flavodoxin domain-containing protein n=1 Tax=Robertkochia sediminum TaxID=2785326 RepID=UPI001931F8CC|nr:flavodoxin domain-containing protein [Robertkochia sediminum]MBL7473238.1 protoporphyrinogen oxidase [Robertkochia sediminum]
MKFLIIYGTSEGQTRKIARFIEEVIENQGHRASIANATDEPPAPDAFDSILIGSSIHMHKYHPAVVSYVNRHHVTLNRMPSVFFSVCMAVASDIREEHEEAQQIAREFLEAANWKTQEVWHVAGALKYTQYDYFKRLVMRMIAKRQGGDTDTSKDHEYTNWEDLKNRIGAFLKKTETAVDSTGSNRSV